MFELPASPLSHLQRVQNTVAQLILGLNKQSHITPALQQLHWLPVKFWIIFKVAALMHNIFHHCAPRTSVILSLSVPVILIVELWSSTVRSAMVCHTRTQFGRHAFTVCVPHIWNNLATNLRLIDSHAAFLRAPKTHLFNTTFNS